ncbi:hypothetical protein [Streptomyces jumonjinensis]|uniref:Uncharacterized protein n=1 Tax=Streptomyces jumonjinensis TaxID=1945 RepID=A0A646KDT7_STRJU|nr:hypothetical protein [Streptomyces jumonjinensis]MQT00364.1 hypothetical protein [Streptomyces jumonjinensis]
MSIEKQLTAARQQLTGESLRSAGLRVKELSSWGSLIPAAGDAQRILESILLQHIGVPQSPSRLPLGIAEVRPWSNRLEIRFEQPDRVRAALEMLPYRERGQRAVHGTPGLWASTIDGNIEIAFARHPNAAVVALSCLDRSDLGPLLSAYESALATERRVPLWTVAPSALPPEKFGGRRKPRPLTIIDHHSPAANLASALLRRIRFWDRLAGHASIRMTCETVDHGLDWHLEREVHPDFPLHDDRLVALLAEPVVGPGLLVDLNEHRCDDRRCVMEFTAPADRLEGWHGVLRLQSVPSDPALHTPPRPRHFTGLGESAYPSHGDSALSSSVAPGSIPSRSRRTETLSSESNQFQGRCFQLLAPRFSRDQWEMQSRAMEIGAAWALDGCSVLVVAHSFSFSPESRRLRYHNQLTWDTADRPTVTASPPWRKIRLVPGDGSLFMHKAFGSRKEVKSLIQEARAHLDWIIFVDCNEDLGMGPYIEESVDSHVIVVNDPGYEENLVTAEARNGVAEHREVPVGPAESAMAWRHQHLTGLPLDRVPISGLVLRQPANREKTQSLDFVHRVDAELKRFGTPVLARLPKGPTFALGASPTVLDDVDEDFRMAFRVACASFRPALEKSSPCLIPPPPDPWR